MKTTFRPYRLLYLSCVAGVAFSVAGWPGVVFVLLGSLDAELADAQQHS